MKKLLMTALKTSISEVMETMFFLPVEFGETVILAQSQMDQTNLMACELAFTGDICGRLILLAPRSLVAEMTENFMGEPRDSLKDELLSGTLTEMLNMVCGNALSKTKSKEPFELNIPEMIDSSKISGKENVIIVETIESKMAILLKMD